MWVERLAEPTPEEVRSRLEAVFRRAEFQRSPTWWDRLVRRLGEWLERLFGDAEPSAPSAGWGGPVAQLVLWIVLVALAVALVALIAVVVARRVRRAPRESDAVEVELEEERSIRDWARLAAEHEAARRWKDALRCRYRELVGVLVEREVVPTVPGRTTGELRDDVAGAAPVVAEEFSEATLLFELAWYADRPTGSEENQRFRALAASVVSATATGPRSLVEAPA